MCDLAVYGLIMYHQDKHDVILAHQNTWSLLTLCK